MDHPRINTRSTDQHCAESRLARWFARDGGRLINAAAFVTFRRVPCANVLINKINKETCGIKRYRNGSEIPRSHQHCSMPEHSSGVSELQGAEPPASAKAE
jgi:hypothetical protein